MPLANNPIQSVVAVNIDGSPITGATTYDNLPIPSSYEVTVIDVSSPDAGRTEDTAMHKMRIGQSLRIDVEWSYPTRTDCAYVMTAFNAEYMNITFIDPRVASGFVTKRFYVGDRKMPLWNSYHSRWENLSFGIIQQNSDSV